MDTLDHISCCGCLSSDRKIVLLEEFWKKNCFLQILQELTITQSNDLQVWLCWECEATISRMVKFKKQVQKSYTLLQNHTTKEQHLFSSSHLHTQRVISLSLSPDTTETDIKNEFQYELVKLEDSNNFDIKEEPSPDNVSICSEHSDDKFLIEISTKKKSQKLLNGAKKRRRKRDLKPADTELESNIYKELELKRDEIEEERRLQAEREEYTNAMFRCERCIVTFPNADDLKDHENIKHVMNASNYVCSICKCSFATEVSYNYHTNKHLRRYQCLVCLERFGSKRGVTKHYEMVHCFGTDVEYNFDNKPLDNRELEEVDNVNDNNAQRLAASFPCEYCQKTFRWKTSLRKHVETHRIEAGQKRRPYCEPCRLSFTTTSNLQKHVKTSSKHQIQLKLRKLKPSVTDDTTIEQIKTSVNSARQTHPCGQCDKRFQWRGNLLRHLHSHAARANGELVCQPCNRTFSSIATYKQHMKISKKHVSENDFKHMCSECGKRFANKPRLKDHVDWEHLKNYVHRCALCQKVFKSHTSLYLHRQVVHQKDSADHLCDHCGKAFPNHAKLRSHMVALHTSECPYACGECGARFSWHSCLSRHRRRVHRAPPRGHRRPGGAADDA